ncbi:MAG TPA: DUF6364 family protein [Prolixibacteraceae bacterium]|nr:DUF6364 family protein [Prolixibacteraceae bacterium]
MNTKLTLKLDKSVIEKAKQYAQGKNISHSKMIDNYLQALTNSKDEEIEISPLVESLIGIIKPSSTNHEKDYTDFLTEKYK